MYKSYYYLSRLTLELNSLISGKNIVSIFSQDKDRLVIHLDGTSELFIEVSVNHSYPYITIKDKFSRAKKNTIDFFPELINKAIHEVLIASDDRIIKFTTNSGDLIFTIRGKYTNLFFNSVFLVPLKNEGEENLFKFKQEFESKIFRSSQYIPDSAALNGKSIEEIRQTYRFIGREIENEVIARKNNEASESDLMLTVLQEIYTASPAVFFDERSCEIHIGFNSMQIYSIYQKQLFDSIIKAFNFFLNKKYQYEEKSNKLKKLNSYIDKALKKNSSKLNNLLHVVEKGSQEDEYNKIANLLLINLNKIHPGISEIEIDNIYSGDSKLMIKLDRKISPQKNIDRYFEKSRDSKINFEKSSKLYLSTKKEFERLKLYQKKIENNPTLEEISLIMKELKMKDDEKQTFNEEIELKFKHYLIEKKYHVFVGKDSVNNDLLTTRFAKQNDFWFHARSVSGSHVVLRNENTKEIVPKGILKKVAALAAYHSKAKTAGVVPVSYTFKKYVVKRKGQTTGQITLLKEHVLLVKPEIPSDTDYLTA